MGMPEITLGILPGRRRNAATAAAASASKTRSICCSSGAIIDSSRARELGLIDEIIGDDALEGGIEFARQLIGEWRRAAPHRLQARASPAIG